MNAEEPHQPRMHPEDQKLFKRMSMCLIIIGAVTMLVASKVLGMHDLIAGIMGMGLTP